MTLSQIVILSVVQGITEFLPISSSAHLVLVPHLLKMADQGLIMDLAVHIGTLLAVLVYYRRDVWDMGMSVLDWNNQERALSRRLAIYIVLSTIPAVVFGAAIHFALPDGIRSLQVITVTTLVFGVLMGIADKKGGMSKTMADMTLKSAFMIGLAQAVALIPGTSRSGITMTTARFLGFGRVDAARFSFLLGIPATAAAGMIGLVDLLKSGDAGLGIDAALGVAFSFLAAIFAIHFMMKWLKKFGLLPFVIYRLILGGVLLVVLF